MSLSRGCGAVLYRLALARYEVCRSKSAPNVITRRVSNRRGGSSAKYLDRQRRDQYVRKRNQEGVEFVSRSAYKLVQLAQKYPLFRPGRTVVDLGAAPGGWCQAVRSICPDTRLFALDLLPMQASVPDVTFLQGDFTHEGVRAELQARIAAQRGGDALGKVDVVLSDMMANTSGNPIRDSQASLDLCMAAFDFCRAVLRPTPDAEARITRSTPFSALPSAFVCKYFMSAEADEFRRDVLAKHFRSVRSEKMDASRAQSREQYWVCLNYHG